MSFAWLLWCAHVCIVCLCLVHVPVHARVLLLLLHASLLLGFCVVHFV